MGGGVWGKNLSVKCGRQCSAADGLPTDNHDLPIWSTDASGEMEGSINGETGVFTAGTAAGGPYAVSVVAGLLTDDATVTVVEGATLTIPVIIRNHNCGVLI